MISAVVLTKNEEKNIEECLASLSFCDEIIVIDDYSTDNTASIAKKNAKVFTHSLENDFSTQRNFGLEKAKGDWILFVDGDERVSKDLQKEILSVVASPTHNGYFIKRDDYFHGKLLKYGETADVKLLRLGKKEKGAWKGKVHEIWEITDEKGELTHPLQHFSHLTINTFLREINFYTDIRAKELFEKKVKVGWHHIIIYPLGKFMQNYIIKRGFLDGVEGAVMAICMSFHSFLVRGKLWQLWDQKNSSH